MLLNFVWMFMVISTFFMEIYSRRLQKLLLLIPIYMIPALLYANLMEARVYHELNVVIALAATSGLIKDEIPQTKS